MNAGRKTPDRAGMAGRLFGGVAMLVAAILAGRADAAQETGAAPGEAGVKHPGEIRRTARETLTPVELNPGETLLFTLKNGQTRRLILLETSANRLLANTGKTPPGGDFDGWQVGGKTVYCFTALVEADGHRLELRRYVGVQESFYEPCVINGMRLWFDAVDDIFGILKEGHGKCRPGKKARLAVQDASLDIAPEKVVPWFRTERNSLDIRESYEGDDCWMGAYGGSDAHGGLDINMPDGTPLYAPVTVNDQYLLLSVAKGGRNNRWEGRRRWPDGSTWILQVAHVTDVTAREHTPLKRGAAIGRGAGMSVGYAEHSHFNFSVTENGGEVMLDPWIVFWQAFENRRKSSGEIRASIKPFGPTRTGEEAGFRSDGSRPGRGAGKLRCHWTFGDGGFSTQANPAHVYTRPGLHPVTLTVDDGRGRASCTHLITVDGEPVPRPALVMAAPEEVSFRARPPGAMDVYGTPPAAAPHTLRFTTMSTGAIEMLEYTRTGGGSLADSPWCLGPRRVFLENSGGGSLAPASPPRIDYENGRGWLKAVLTKTPEGEAVEISIEPVLLPSGLYRAKVTVDAPGTLNSPQDFLVELRAVPRSPFWNAAVDDADPECWATPYFWIAPRLPVWWSKPGHGGRCLMSGGRATEGEFVRYTPFLWGGTYDVWFGHDTPFTPGDAFDVRVRHRRGIATVRTEPARSRKIGTFEFPYGAEGWVEIEAGGSRGQSAADTIVFIRVGD